MLTTAESQFDLGKVLNARLGVFSLLVHDVQDHPAGSRAALGGGVDADRLLGSTSVLLTVHINPAGEAKSP